MKTSMMKVGVLSSLVLLGAHGTQSAEEGEEEIVSMLQAKSEAKTVQRAKTYEEDMTDLSHLSELHRTAIADFYKKANCQENCEEFHCGDDCTFFECDGEWCDASCNCGFTMKELEATGCPNDCKGTTKPDGSLVEIETETDEADEDAVVEDAEMSDTASTNTSAGWGGRRRRRWFSWPARRRAPSCNNNCKSSFGKQWTGYVEGKAPVCGANRQSCTIKGSTSSQTNVGVTASKGVASGSVNVGHGSSSTYVVQNRHRYQGQSKSYSDGGTSCWTGTKACCCEIPLR